MEISPPDLTIRPPRSPRVRLGGFVILPRMLDKCRAALAGTNGEFKYDCPMDGQFLNFTGIDAEALKEQARQGRGDGEILEWVQENIRAGITEAEIAGWCAFQEARAPAALDKRSFFSDCHTQLAPRREDIATWFDLLDLDDFVTFGGRP